MGFPFSFDLTLLILLLQPTNKIHPRFQVELDHNKNEYFPEHYWLWPDPKLLQTSPTKADR